MGETTPLNRVAIFSSNPLLHNLKQIINAGKGAISSVLDPHNLKLKMPLNDEESD